jgi:anti-anti-sigma factor
MQNPGHRLDMEQAIEILLEQLGDVTLFDIKGDVTALSEPFLNDAFDKNAYINSGGIALLIQILAETKKNNQQIGITGLSDHFKKIFNMVGITKFTKIYNTREEALESML